MRKWIGLDPSVARFGYAILQRFDPTTKPVVTALGTMTTDRMAGLGVWEERAARFRELGADLAALLAANPGVEAAYIEQPVFAVQNGKKSIHVAGRARGLAEGLCAALRIPLTEVPPKVLKLAVAGSETATKEAVSKVVRAYYGIGEVKSLDATDALAIAHVGAFRSATSLVVTSGTVRYTATADEEE